MAYDFNGTTVSFGGVNVTKLRSVRTPSKVGKIKVTGSDDSTELYEPGKPDPEARIDVVGIKPWAVGQKGTLVITWNDGTVDNLGNCFVESREPAGQLNGEIVTSYAFAPTPA